jgi:hypothetical protein
MTTDSNEGLFVLDEDGEVRPTEYAHHVLDEAVIGHTANHQREKEETQEMSATNDDMLKETIKTAGLNEENAKKAMLMFEAMVIERLEALTEAIEAKVIGNLREEIDAYITEEMAPYIDESVDELRNLMRLAVATIGGQDAVAAFIKRVAALARAGTLSASSGDWAAAAPDDSVSNSATIAGGGVNLRKEEVEEVEKVHEIFDDVTADMSEDDREQMKVLSEDLVYGGDAQRLRSQLTSIKLRNFYDAGVAAYSDAISRSVRKA